MLLKGLQVLKTIKVFPVFVFNVSEPLLCKINCFCSCSCGLNLITFVTLIKHAQPLSLFLYCVNSIGLKSNVIP